MRYVMGPPYLMIEPMDDAVTTLFPSQRRENKLTDTRPARVCIVFQLLSHHSKKLRYHAGYGGDNGESKMYDSDDVGGG
jgi:hypothetical protein